MNNHIRSHLLKKSLMENSMFLCRVNISTFTCTEDIFQIRTIFDNWRSILNNKFSYYFPGNISRTCRSNGRWDFPNTILHCPMVVTQERIADLVKEYKICVSVTKSGTISKSCSRIWVFQKIRKTPFCLFQQKNNPYKGVL